MKLLKLINWIGKQNLFNNINDHNSLTWQTNSNQLKLRLIMVIVGFLFFFSVLGYKLLFVTYYNSSLSKTYSNNNLIQRKAVVDREGNYLALNILSSSLYAIPKKIINPKHDLRKIAAIIPSININKLLEGFEKNKNFVWIKRDITPKEQAQIVSLGIPGFDFEREQRRIYTFPHLMCHTLGYVGRDFIGLTGLEKSYDNFLNNNESSDQENLILTIDIRLQNILSEEIDKAISEYRAVGGAGIIVNPNNGEILAMVSKPDFNPHHPGSASLEQQFNRATLGINEVGSVFKTITLAIGFDLDSITMRDVYDISAMKIGKFNIKDYHKSSGWHTVPEIFLHSSNIGVSQIILEIGSENFQKYLKQLGLFNQINIEIPEKAQPLYPRANNWSELTLITMSYGYGISISPLHFVQAMIPIVNGGYFYPVTLIKNQKSNLQPLKILKTTTSQNINKLLRLVVEKGTGRKAEVAGYYVGGKTGTAEKLSGKSYNKDKRISSFIAIMPATKPEYLIYIVLDEPKPTKETFGFATAGWTAAPVVSKVFEKIITLYGIKPIDSDSPEAQEIVNFDVRINDAL